MLHINSQIGLSSLIVLIFAFLLIGCIGDKEHFDIYYGLEIENNSSDTLEVIFGDEKSEISYSVDKVLYKPWERKAPGGWGATLLEGEDPVYSIFSQGSRGLELVTVLKDDSIVYQWQGPLREMGDTLNHFHNVSSWEVIKDDNLDDVGYILFKLH